MVTTGITGSSWRASVTAWGGIEPWDDTPHLDWYVAADDRWHAPAREAAVRQIRLDGTPVTETRVRVPHGDVVQRVFSVPDAGGITVVEVENESTLPVAVAFDRGGLLTERPIAENPIEGIDLPDDSFVLPLGHRAGLRVGVAHGAQRAGRLPAGLPDARQVANGWLTLTERASRLLVPDGDHGLASQVTTQRSDLALGMIPTAEEDPAGFAVALGELVRMGDRPDPWLPELVEAVESLGRDPSWAAGVGLAAADRVLAVAGERRAARDLARITARRGPCERPPEPPSGTLLVAWFEEQFARGGALLPHGLPAAWLGRPVEVHGVPTSASGTVSFALRWHGDRPAVLWEQTGTPVELTAPAIAPGWSSSERAGEALWPPPPGVPDAALRASEPPPEEPVSFS